ncbi:Uncharacterised protein [Mycobacteroides abscessus subsp. abscessus]|nr:Uncharacterised protein [Mycobacteroides abscessus subsp. abscessus]
MTTRLVTPSPTATKTSPAAQIAGGTDDHPKRWSRALITIIAVREKYQLPMSTFCRLRVSATGPARLRRWCAAGSARCK